MTEAMETLTAATFRLDAARERLGIAEVALNALVPNVPLRSSVAAAARLRTARAELADAEAAFDAAQDAPAPQE